MDFEKEPQLMESEHVRQPSPFTAAFGPATNPTVSIFNRLGLLRCRETGVWSPQLRVSAPIRTGLCGERAAHGHRRGFLARQQTKPKAGRVQEKIKAAL